MMTTFEIDRDGLDRAALRRGDKTLRQIAIETGLERLREAREHFKLAETPMTLRKVRNAIKSAEGAQRNAYHHPLRKAAR
jgi:hypothetical protein